MIFSILLSAFFFSPGDGSGVKPVELTGIARDDWTNHAETASVCAVRHLPDANILEGWKRLGVKMLKRVDYDPDDSASYFRRRVGFLAVREGADGVWLPDRERFPESFRVALEEAKADVDVVLYACELAARALAHRETDWKLWTEGRRLNWFFEFMDYEGENVDTLRLEFACFAKRLEQLLRVKPRELPLALPKAPVPDRVPSVPFKGRDVVTVAIAPKEEKKPVALAPGLEMGADFKGWKLTLRGKCPAGRKEFPDGFATVRFYIPAPGGGYNPYEILLDLGNLPETPRAPEGASGWYGRERWLRGPMRLYMDTENWRCRPVWHDAHSRRYPHVAPAFRERFTKDGEWEISLSYGWLGFFGFWPMLRNNASDCWYVSVEGVKGVPDAHCRVEWPKGRESNLKKFGGKLDYDALTKLYEEQKERADGIYRLWYDERLYGFPKTDAPTYHRGDGESDRIFWERVVEPRVREADERARVTHENNDTGVRAKIRKADEPVKLALWKSLDKMIYLGSDVSLLRCDYILQRFAGKMPPEPEKLERRAPPGAKGPDVNNDDDVIQLDEEAL